MNDINKMTVILHFSVDFFTDSCYHVKDDVIANKAEVVTMCITEYNEVETMEAFKEEGHDSK